MGRRVRKFDGAFGPEGCGGGFAASFIKKGRGWRRGLCRRVVYRFAQGATAPAALRVADCRSAAMLIKSALRDWLSASYGMISITSISHLRWLPPLWWLAPPPFPRKRGHYKAPLCCELLMKGLLCGALLSHRPAGGRWCRKAPKGDCIFSPVRAAVWFSLLPQGSIYTGAHKGAHHNPRAKGASNLSPLRTFGPAGRQPSSPIGACP